MLNGHQNNVPATLRENIKNANGEPPLSD